MESFLNTSNIYLRHFVLLIHHRTVFGAKPWRLPSKYFVVNLVYIILFTYWVEFAARLESMDVKTGGMGQLFFYYGVREGAGAPSDEGACQGWPIGVLFLPLPALQFMWLMKEVVGEKIPRSPNLQYLQSWVGYLE